MENKSGLIRAPYVSITNSTSINGETVWYRNKFKNFLLKIKFFFKKPKYSHYSSKMVNSKYYGIIEIKK